MNDERNYAGGPPLKLLAVILFLRNAIPETSCDTRPLQRSVRVLTNELREVNPQRCYLVRVSASCREFIFDALADRLLDRIARLAAQRHIRFGFGAVAGRACGSLPIDPEIIIGEQTGWEQAWCGSVALTAVPRRNYASWN